MGRPTKIEGNPEHPASLGATDAFTQAAILDLYDPDRAQTVTHRGEVAPWGDFLAAMQSALAARRPSKGAGLRFLTGPDHLAVAGRADGDDPGGLPAGQWHQYDPVASAPAPRPAGSRPRRRRSTTSTRPTSSSRSTPTSWLRSRLVRYQKDFAGRASRHRRPQGDEPALRGREHAVAHRHEGRSPARRCVPREIEAFARELAGSRRRRPGPRATGERQRRAAGRARPRQVGCRGRQGSAGAPRHVARRRRATTSPPPVHALAHAMNQALGNVGTTVTYGASIDASRGPRRRR